MEALLEILGKIGFDWRVALANFANFLIVFYLLNRFVFSKLKVVIAERQRKIDEGIENSEKAERFLADAETEREKVLGKAKREATLVLADAQAEREAVIEKAKTEAKDRAHDILLQTEKDVHAEKEAARQAISEEAASLVVRGMEAVLSKEHTPVKDEAYIKTLMKQV